MKSVFITVLLLSCMNGLNAQKPPITHTTGENWPEVASHGISANGKYMAWTDARDKEEFTVQTTDGKWKRKLHGQRPRFSGDSKWLIVPGEGDRLTLLKLGTDKSEQITGAGNLKFSEPVDWMAYRTAEGVRVRNIATGKVIQLPGTDNYFFNNTGDALIYHHNNTLHWVDLPGGKDIACWTGNPGRDFVFSSSGTRMVFLTASGEGDQEQRSLWYYAKGTEQAIELTSDVQLGNGKKISDGEIAFSADGERVFFNLKPPAPVKPGPDAVSVDVWSYTDLREQGWQLAEANPANEYSGYRPPPLPRCVVNIGKNVLQLTTQDDQILAANGGYALVENSPGDKWEGYWNRAVVASLHIISLNDGTRKVIYNGKDSGIWGIHAWLSPAGRYVVMTDWQKKNYRSYDISAGRWLDMKGSGEIIKEGEGGQSSALLCAWVEEQDAVLFRDDHDIWKLDLTGQKNPVNVTAGIGRRDSLVFKLLWEGYDYKPINLAQDHGGGYLLNVFDEKDKSWGFYRLADLSGRVPQRLTMGPYYYGGDGPLVDSAKEASVYIVRRETPTESKNLFITKDFKSFDRISDLHPEKGFNWMTAELMRWQTFDGSTCDGILYKPENFDPSKKYPVVVMFYNTFSKLLNEFTGPDERGGYNYIPTSWLVSNGYIVFIPDVFHKKGEPFKSAYNCVVSGAKQLAAQSWVDGAHMGLMGASWGGAQINYLATKTDLFAAIVTGAGMSERISEYGYGKPYLYSNSTMQDLEVGGGLMGGAPWEVPERYISEAAMLSVHHVKAPILIKHNINDSAVPFYQGLQFFRALRRLGKRAWLLQYDNGEHGILPGKQRLDMNIRMEQFFAHYLKGAPAPKWMLDGIPARLKGIETRLELDTTGRTPIPGILNN